MNAFPQAARTASSPRSGVALVISLFFIAIISLLVIAFLDSARVESSSANIHVERMRATAMASQGVETLVATLRRETVDPPRKTGESAAAFDRRVRHWTSQPGQLTVPEPPKANGSVDQKRLVQTVALHSGQPSRQFLEAPFLDPVLLPPNLNVQTLVDQAPPTYLLNDPAPPAAGAPAGEPDEMKLRWIYLREKPDANGNYQVLDPDGLPTEKPVLTKSNPIVGRFAYWADDESTKVNYNLAWTRDPAVNQTAQGHPTKVDLRALPGFSAATADALHGLITPLSGAGRNYETIKRFFNSPFDARIAGDATIRAALDQNRFSLTHFNSDPDTTYYGRSRMMLTTQLANAAIRDAGGNVVVENGKPLTRPFLDILKRTPATSTAFVDPGVLANLDGNKLNARIKDLVENYLKRSDWPMVDGTGHSLQEKYYGAYAGLARDQRLAQLAVNIIDYVRSAESPKLIVEPIRGKYIGTDFITDHADTSLRGKEDTYKGLTRGLHVTELGMYVADKPETSGPNAGRYLTYCFVEVHLPRNYGIDSVDLLGTVDDPGGPAKRWQAYFYELTGGGRSSKYFFRDGKAWTTDPTHSEFRQIEHRDTLVLPANANKFSTAFVWEAVGNRAKTIMKPGEYRTIAIEAWREKSKKDASRVSLRGALTINTGLSSRVDVAPIGDPGTAKPTPLAITYTLPLVTTSPSVISSYETNDPRVNGVAGDWVLASSNSFSCFGGGVNRATTAALGQPPTTAGSSEPELDLDVQGRLTDASLRMPYPSGHAANPTGRVRSPGELGIIHTGIEGSSIAPRGGIPWRTLRLQPSKLDTKVVPDWAFMDLFTVPADVPVKAATVFAPHSNSTGGRVNMNAKPVPFSLERETPLAAVLFGARKNLAGQTLTKAESDAIALNIYQRVRAKAGAALPPGKAYPAPQSGRPDVYECPGEVVEIAGVADQGEQSEELVREIANLITARGNVFSVYTIGQALKQTPAGKLLVTGEQRQHAIVERYVLDKGTATLDDDAVGFRTLYFRNLIP